jgi:hypothetical protein
MSQNQSGLSSEVRKRGRWEQTAGQAKEDANTTGVGDQCHYSLNDACRIRTMASGPSVAIKCPTCGGHMGGVAGGSGKRTVLLLVCCGCGRRLVLSDST